jgi:DNA-binding NarL/FixJ family response regulator
LHLIFAAGERYRIRASIYFSRYFSIASDCCICSLDAAVTKQVTKVTSISQRARRMIGCIVTSPAEASQPAIRIVIAEDQALVRRGAALLLSMESDMEVVGQACNGVEAVELTQLLRPDVVLMDLHMPLKGGVVATREITRALPHTQVLVLTTLDDDETVFEAVRAGAHAYLLKDAAENELLETIRALKRGESRLTPQIARKVMDQFRRLAQSGQSESLRAELAAAAPEAEALNEKEEKVLELIAEGMSNRQIGSALFLAEGTVKNYVSRIMDKLHANTRTELAILSQRQRRAEY